MFTKIFLVQHFLVSGSTTKKTKPAGSALSVRETQWKSIHLGYEVAEVDICPGLVFWAFVGDKNLPSYMAGWRFHFFKNFSPRTLGE